MKQVGNSKAVIDAQTDNFSELVRLSGLEPGKHFQHLDLSGVDFSGSHLDGFDFTGSRMINVKFDGSFISGATFDATQRGLPELQAAEDYNDAVGKWREQSENRKPHGKVSGEWLSIWPNGDVPGWVDEYGTDSYGKWASFAVDGIAQVMRYCPPGRYLMGSPKDEKGRYYNEGPQQRITFERGFWLGDTAVSQALYEVVMRRNPGRFKSPNKPVESVSWNQAVSFTHCLNVLVPGLGVHLPSEAAWEYACRAGYITPFNPVVGQMDEGQSITTGEVNYGRSDAHELAIPREYLRKTVSVTGGGFRPNNWGLWHMHGNVLEWCADTWSHTLDGVALDGTARSAPELASGLRNYVLRGGSWAGTAGECRSSSQSFSHSDHREDFFGFRVAAGQIKSPDAER